MTDNLFIEILNKLGCNSISIPEIYEKCFGKNLNYEQAEQFFYSTERNNRFELFIALYEASLKNSIHESFRAFREAYCTSDNIYAQIKNSQFSFDIKGYISSMKKQNINFLDLMNEEEISYYNNLPEVFTVYRGMSNAEYNSQDYGISWTLSRNTAEKYVYCESNNVQKGEGGVAHIEISKKSIITVFSVHGDSEIIYKIESNFGR